MFEEGKAWVVAKQTKKRRPRFLRRSGDKANVEVKSGYAWKNRGEGKRASWIKPRCGFSRRNISSRIYLQSLDAEYI